MIAKATAISHGINALRYITGESAHKKHPEKIHPIATYFFDGAFTAQSMFEAIRFKGADYPRLKNNIIRIEVSPAEEYTRDFIAADWKKLWEEFAVEFDNQEISDEKTGKVISPKTHIARSKATVWLHRDSRSGIPHLHAAVCRVDESGELNNDHQIHLRAQRAAERIARRRGWTTAEERHDEHVRQAERDCTAAIQSMDCWSWADYVASLEGKGYNIRERRDSKGILCGYTLRKGNIIIKASELKGRTFMASRLEDTWRKIHTQKMSDVPTQRTARTSTATGSNAAGTTAPPPKPTAQSVPQQSNLSILSTSQSSAQSSAPQVVDSATQPPVPSPKQNYVTLIDYTQYRDGTTSYTLEHNGQEHRLYIPEKVMDLFNEEFDYRETANWQELTNLAIVLFIGMAGGPATVPPGGGGSSADNNWGRDKDEDDLRRARRCASAAIQKLGKQPKYGLRR
ncbi:relaxase [uncultured Bacteroides sp.]|uniref:relaxase n=1 Tax=uncultured Bacteroides sp. TaxID=162156 RepID=UPI00261A91C5|nr:relaxase [uncultured Bacteroides sp.]